MLRSLTLWSWKRIAILWAAFAAVIVVAIAMTYVESRQTSTSPFFDDSFDWEGAPRLSRPARDSLQALAFVLLKEFRRDSAERLSAQDSDDPMGPDQLDSLMLALEIPARLTPAQRDSLRAIADEVIMEILPPVVAGVVAGSSQLMPLLIAFFVVMCGVPIALVLLTIAWIIARRRYDPAVDGG